MERAGLRPAVWAAVTVAAAGGWGGMCSEHRRGSHRFSLGRTNTDWESSVKRDALQLGVHC